jgi:hypothetical protein
MGHGEGSAQASMDQRPPPKHTQPFSCTHRKYMCVTKHTIWMHQSTTHQSHMTMVMHMRCKERSMCNIHTSKVSYTHT